MSEAIENTPSEPTLKSLIDTPFKKFAAIGFMVCNTLFFTLPFIVPVLGNWWGWSLGKIATYTGTGMVVSESFGVLFFLILGKAAASLIKSKIIGVFKRNKGGSNDK